MEVEAACSSSKHYPQEIDQLLEAFGSAFSIDYIASTYLQANCNIDMAGELLCEFRATAAITASQQPKDDTDKVSCNSSGFENRPCVAQGDSKVLDFGEGPVLTENAHKDMGDFLFKMLGEGFQLDMEVIHGVLSSCGYNLEKSVEILLDKRASTFGERDDILSKAAKIPRNNEKMADLSCEGKSLHRNSVRSSKKRNKGKNDLEKELLQSLFTVSNIPEEEPKKCHPRKPVSSFGRFGRVVTAPLEDSPIEQKTLYVTPLHPSKDEDEDEDSFVVLSQAVKEHWATMKGYYKAAGEAFVKGDRARADNLMAKVH